MDSRLVDVQGLCSSKRAAEASDCQEVPQVVPIKHRQTMRYWASGRLCTFALTVSNLAAPVPGGPSLVLVGTGLRPVANEQDDLMSAIADHSPSLPASGTLGMRLVGRAGQRTL